MPPCRTVPEICAPSSPHSRAMMPMASSADLRCCTSKSGGTYSASITGVIGSTLTRRTDPPDERASVTAASMAGLAKSVSARSIGTRICLYMTAPLFFAVGVKIMARFQTFCLRMILSENREHRRRQARVPSVRFDPLALQLRSSFYVGSAGFGLMCASPEGPCDDVGGPDASLRKTNGDAPDFLN